MKLRIIVSLAMGVLLAALASQANAQGRVRVYNWNDYIAPDAVKDFEKATGVKVTYDLYDSNEVLDAKLRAGKSGYDVVVPTASPFLARQIPAKLYQKIDRDKLKNWSNLDPAILKQLERYDPGNQYGIPWMWGTVGIGYNVDRIKKIMPDAPVDSLRMLFDPAIVAKFKDCGVMVLDSATDMIPAALAYLGLDPDSKRVEDLKKAEELFKTVRPFIRKFHSSEYINALAQGQVCIAFGFSGDIFQAKDRADKAKSRQKIEYVIPREGALMWIDVLAIPADAPNLANAYRFIDHLLDAKVAAASSNEVRYANGNAASKSLIAKDVTGNPNIYPPPALMQKLYAISAPDRDYERARTRSWTAIKTGK